MPDPVFPHACWLTCVWFSAGVIIVGVVFGSKRLGCNPDNVATPMAASFGDLLTLTLLAYCSQLFYSVKGKRDEDYLVHFLYWPAGGSGTLKLTSMHPRVTFFLVFYRFISFCVVPGGSLLCVPGSTLGVYCFKTSSKSASPSHRMGSDHCCNGHLQVRTPPVHLRPLSPSGVSSTDYTFSKVLLLFRCYTLLLDCLGFVPPSPCQSTEC